jgi:predicted PilT family ATPase
MIHRELQNEDDAHYGVSTTVDKKYVLLQLGKRNGQVRVKLDIDEVASLIELLINKGEEIIA